MSWMHRLCPGFARSTGRLEQGCSIADPIHLIHAIPWRALCGVISDRDLRRAVSGTAADVMSAEPIVVGSDVPLSTAVTILLNRSISCLPVVDDCKLIGSFAGNCHMLRAGLPVQAAFDDVGDGVTLLSWEPAEW